MNKEKMKKKIAENIVSLSQFVIKNSVGKSFTIIGHEVPIPFAVAPDGTIDERPLVGSKKPYCSLK